MTMLAADILYGYQRYDLHVIPFLEHHMPAGSYLPNYTATNNLSHRTSGLLYNNIFHTFPRY